MRKATPGICSYHLLDGAELYFYVVSICGRNILILKMVTRTLVVLEPSLHES